MRQTWAGVKQAMTTAESNKRKDGEADGMDALLPQPDLDDLAVLLCSRHKLAFPPEVDAADAMVSRLNKEIKRRMTTVRDM